MTIIKIIKNYDFKNYGKYYKSEIEIKENLKSKINEIFCKCVGNKKIKFYCGPYENITKIEFIFFDIITNLKDIFPLFNNNCKIIFKSLKYFKFQCESPIDLEILDNIYQNIDYISNIKYFHFHCITQKINEKLYLKIIDKILKMKLDFLYLEIKSKRGEKNEEYKKDELEKLFPNNTFSELTQIHIKKLNKI